MGDPDYPQFYLGKPIGVTGPPQVEERRLAVNDLARYAVATGAVIDYQPGPLPPEFPKKTNEEKTNPSPKHTAEEEHSLKEYSLERAAAFNREAEWEDGAKKTSAK